MRRSKMHNSLVSQPSTPLTPASLISTIIADNLTKATLREGSPNILKVTPKFLGWKTMKQSTHSLDANHLSRQKDNMVSSSRQGAPATCSSAPSSGGDAAGGSGHSPGGSKQEVAHLAMVVSEDDDFANDPHHIIPTEEVFAVPSSPQDDLQGFNEGYLLPMEVSAFRGTYYHESRDVRPGYTGASPFDYSLDQQGHVALKLHSGTAAYYSYIGLILTGIVYPQHEDPLVPIDQYNYFDVIGTILPIANHGIWGCFHFLPLMSNIFLACYDSGTLLSHLTEGGYGFDVLGLPGITLRFIPDPLTLQATERPGKSFWSQSQGSSFWTRLLQRSPGAE